ncbi:MAG: holin family protein [Nitrospirae bacterium]|nr:holin family protein [Nitrospirota bacterium]
MAFDPITSILDLGTSLINKIFPDPAQRDAAKLQLIALKQNGELDELKTNLSVMLAEAQNADKWTSRARPSFLYVMYIMILASIPMGITYAISPTHAADIATGMAAWLKAIPDGMWSTFGIGYSGYAIARSYDKKINK